MEVSVNFSVNTTPGRTATYSSSPIDAKAINLDPLGNNLLSSMDITTAANSNEGF